MGAKVGFCYQKMWKFCILLVTSWSAPQNAVFQSVYEIDFQKEVKNQTTLLNHFIFKDWHYEQMPEKRVDGQIPHGPTSAKFYTNYFTAKILHFDN